MKIVEAINQSKMGLLAAFVITSPALVAIGFKVYDIPYVHFYNENGTFNLNGIVIFAEPFYAFLVQKANVLLTYFPPSFITGFLLAHVFKSKSNETVLRGLKRIETKQMIKVVRRLAVEQAKQFGYSPAYRIALNGVPIPYAAEAQSFFIAGQAGSGKTQAILSLTEQIKNFGETMIFYDRKPDFFPKYYREEKDYLFYPKDERSINFSLLEQISDETVFEDVSFIANAIIPDSSEKDAHFNDSSRAVLRAIFFTLYHNTDRTNKALVEFLRNNQGIQKLRDGLLAYKSAEKYGIDVSAALTDDGQGASVYATLNRFLEPLKNEIFISDKEAFSIKDFVWANEQQNQDIRLFAVQTTKEQGAYSVWYRVFFSLLSREIRSLPNRLNRRIWIFADEFQSLGKMPEIVDELPAEARSKGACLILATQSLAKIKEIYGNELMNSILANTKTKLIFSLGDPYSQKTLEEYFGRQEVEEIRESHSQGIGLESNRLNTSTSTTTKSAILGVELLSLQSLNAFVQIDEYVCKLEFLPVNVLDATSFQPKRSAEQMSLDGLIVTPEFCDASTKFLDSNYSEKAAKNGALNDKLATDLANATNNEEKIALRQQYDIERAKINTPSVNSEYSFELI